MSVLSGPLPPRPQMQLPDCGAEFRLVMKTFPGLLAPCPWESRERQAQSRQSVPAERDSPEPLAPVVAALPRTASPESPECACPEAALERGEYSQVFANIDPAVIENAKYNYARFHEVAVASVSASSVMGSSAGIDGWAGAWHEKIVSLVEASCGPEVAELEFSTFAGDHCSFLLDLDDSVDDLFKLLAREHEVQPYQLKLVLPSQGSMKYRAVDMNVRTLLLEAYKDQDICVKALTTQILPRAKESRKKNRRWAFVGKSRRPLRTPMRGVCGRKRCSEHYAEGLGPTR